jgi:DNA replication and repair protein RecF
MFIKRLEILNFRNHSHSAIEFSPGCCVLIGKNGQGKTNLVEAIHFLSTLSSHRVAGYLPLIKQNEQQAIIRVVAAANDRDVTIEVALNKSEANQAQINKNQTTRMRDLLGLVQSVTFAPEDLDIVKRDPSNRRTFLDELVVQLTPRLAGVFADYGRVLKQRNTLLKTAKQTGAKGSALSTLDAWDEQLVKHGSEIIAARVELVAALEPELTAAYQAIAAENNETGLLIESSILLESDLDDEVGELPVLTTTNRAEIAEMFHAKLAAVRKRELERGLTLVGPQRDELLINLGTLPAKGYASHGESWSLALALRLAAAALLKATSNVGDPILILDDVFAELDDERRRRLAELVAQYEQVLITAAAIEDVPAELVARKFRVTKGEVSLDE